MVVGGRALDVVGGRRTAGGTREFVGGIVRVADVVRCTAGRGAGLLITADFCFKVGGSGLARAKGLSSSIRSGPKKSVE